MGLQDRAAEALVPQPAWQRDVSHLTNLSTGQGDTGSGAPPYLARETCICPYAAQGAEEYTITAQSCY